MLKQLFDIRHCKKYRKRRQNISAQAYLIYNLKTCWSIWDMQNSLS